MRAFLSFVQEFGQPRILYTRITTWNHVQTKIFRDFPCTEYGTVKIPVHTIADWA